jgi:preprotein translocase subunit SecE
MNRETKRMMQRQGQMEADGSPGTRRQATTTAQRRPAQQRTPIVQVGREIRDELRQVAWPTRAEMVNYSAVVLTTLILMISLIFLLNLAFGKSILWLFHP